MTFSVWQGHDSWTIVPGVAPPTFADGTLQEPDAVKIMEFEARDVEEAWAIFARRLEAGEL